MSIEPTRIIIIHDDLEPIDPLIIRLEKKFGSENVVLKSRSSEGLELILSNPTGKNVVLLDLDLGQGEPQGVDILEKIRNQTSLVYVIIMTAKVLNLIPSEQLIRIINNDAMQLISSSTDTQEIINLVESAVHKLSCRIDTAIEEWVIRHKGDKDQPYMTSKEGRTYSLNQILREIRIQSDFGKKLEKNMIELTIDMLTRNEEQIDD